MPEFSNGEKLALMERSRLRPEITETESGFTYPKISAMVQEMRTQENAERAEEIQDLPFLSKEEKEALMSNILPSASNKILLASNTNDIGGISSENGGWQEPFVEFAKDILMPDWTDAMIFMATWPEWPVVKRAIKLPEAVKKFIESFAKYIDRAWIEGIEKSFELFIRTGDKRWLEESISALRKSWVKEKIQMADRMENGMLKIETKNLESARIKSVTKTESNIAEKIPPEPKISEMSVEKLEILKGKSDSYYRRELVELGGKDVPRKSLPIREIQQKLTEFEEHLAYLKEVQKFTPKQLQNVEERYLNVMNDLVRKFNKDAPLFKNVQEAKKYLYPLKTP